VPVAGLGVLPEAVNQMIDRETIVVTRKRSAIRQPLGDAAAICFAARWRIELSEQDVALAKRDNRLTGLLVKSIGWNGVNGKFWHDNSAKKPKNGRLPFWLGFSGRAVQHRQVR
jgi:hypothetical protein